MRPEVSARQHDSTPGRSPAGSPVLHVAEFGPARGPKNAPHPTSDCTHQATYGDSPVSSFSSKLGRNYRILSGGGIDGVTARNRSRNTVPPVFVAHLCIQFHTKKAAAGRQTSEPRGQQELVN